MKIVLKFKDGITVTQDITGWEISGNGNIFKILQENKEKNAPVRVTGINGERLERTFSDLYSIEIVLV